MSGERPAGLLPPEAVTPLLRIWRDLARRTGHEFTRDELRSIARVVGSTAWRARLLPEQLVIGIKESWSAQGVRRRPEELHDARWVVSELISLSVCEYFHTAPGYAAIAAELSVAPSGHALARPACCARRLAAAAAQRPYLVAPDADDLARSRRLSR